VHYKLKLGCSKPQAPAVPVRSQLSRKTWSPSMSAIRPQRSTHFPHRISR